MNIITPLGNKILVEPEKKAEKKTGSGLIVVEGSTPLKKGTVISVSEDIENPKIKRGDSVLYEAGAGVEVNEGEHLLMEYSSAWAKI